MNNNIMLEAALAYVSNGVSVFPCKAHSKDPIGEKVSIDGEERGGCYLATTDEEKIRRWWTQNPDCNIGIPTGESNGFWVLDVDGEGGRQSLQHFSGNIPPDTPQEEPAAVAFIFTSRGRRAWGCTTG